MTPAERRVAKAKEAQAKAEKKHAAAVKAARVALGNSCTHPQEYRRTWKEARDNGYGHWWKVDMRQCKLCGKCSRADVPSPSWVLPEYYVD